MMDGHSSLKLHVRFAFICTLLVFGVWCLVQIPSLRSRVPPKTRQVSIIAFKNFKHQHQGQHPPIPAGGHWTGVFTPVLINNTINSTGINSSSTVGWRSNDDDDSKPVIMKPLPPRWIPSPSTCNHSQPLSHPVASAMQSHARDSGRRFHIVVLGDSVGGRLYDKLAMQYQTFFTGQPKTYNTEVGGERCNDVTRVYKQVAVDTWEPPPPTFGPKAYGLLNPQCHDCSGCYARSCLIGDHVRISFRVMEFCRDMTTQSTKHNTTQEHIVDYLRKASAEVVVFNCGVHDLLPDTHEAYEDNLRWLTHLFLKTNPTISFIFVTTTGVHAFSVGKWQLTTNPRIVKQNQIAQTLMAAHEITVVDFFPFNIKELHMTVIDSQIKEDRVHLDGFDGVAYAGLAKAVGCAITYEVSKRFNLTTSS